MYFLLPMILLKLTSTQQIKSDNRFQLGAATGHCRVVFDAAEFDNHKLYRSFKIVPPENQLIQFEVFDIAHMSLRNTVQYGSVSVKISEKRTKIIGGKFADIKKDAKIDVICRVHKYDGTNDFEGGICLMAVAVRIVEKAPEMSTFEDIEFS